MLRFESPVQVDGGVVAAPVAIGGVELPVGEWVLTLLGAANRDPVVFGSDADRFDVGRDPNPHLAFSSGIHYCLGAPLARLEGTVFFDRFLETFADVRAVDSSPSWRAGIVFRGLQRLEVEGRR
jgi:cytochrome P450